jgi:hypothetical protein
MKIEVSIVWCKSEVYVWALTLLVFEELLCDVDEDEVMPAVNFEEMLCDVDEDVIPSIEYVPECAIKKEPVSEYTVASTQESLSQLSHVKDKEGQRYPCNL